MKNKQQTDEASVDSELAMLGQGVYPTKSAARNPFFKSDKPKGAAGLPQMMLVGRIDGPDWETAQRLIEDAVATEKEGLWGNAYIDLSRMDVTKGAGYKIGDDWLRNVVRGYILDEDMEPALTVAEALEPYLGQPSEKLRAVT